MYSAAADISNVITQASVLQLTDDEGLGSINQARVTAAISSADELINGYLRSRYTLPLASTPPMLKDLSVNLAICNLYQRRFAANMPEAISKQYAASIKLLESIQKGVISLGIEDTAQPASGGGIRTNKTADDRMFSKDELSKY